ncbi:MAG: pentapeptide repeat-containing protein, partial [Aestuariivirgaceae bacterium]
VFLGANLTGTDFSKSDAIRCTFDKADLTGANLTYAILARASFTGAKLDKSNWAKTYLYRTDLSGTDLSGVTGLTQGQIAEACGDDKTTLPEGLTPPASWPCSE